MFNILKSYATRLMMVSTSSMILLSACTSFQKTTPLPEPVPLNIVPTGVHVGGAIHAALERVQTQKRISQDATKPAELDAERGTTMNIRWEGDATEILKKIATQQNLKFKVTGTQPYMPIPVFITLRSVTLVQALEAIGDQLGGRTAVVLHDDLIELRMN